MLGHVGRRAIIVGSGVGGLAAARALSTFFEHITIFERDSAPDAVCPRSGVPQGRQLHALLAGGRQALEALDAGFGSALLESGAVRVTVGFDLRDETPLFHPMPRRDLGFSTYAASRALIEHVLRERLSQLTNITLEWQVSVHAIAAQDGRVCGVQCKRGRGSLQLEAADLVVDASNAGELTRSCLESLGRPAPRTTRIGVDMGYATATFDRSHIDLDGWLACRTQPDMRHSSCIGLMMPLEGGHCYLVLAGQGAEAPPAEPSGFAAAASRLRTPTLAQAIRHAQPVKPITRYRFPESRRHHYDESTSLPLGLLPLGDAICRFNPTYGQGMSVAAQEALLLRGLLATGQPLTDLPRAYLQGCAQLNETPWAIAALPDMLLKESRGERPADFERQLSTSMALQRLAAEDAQVHERVMQVQHLLLPRSALWEGPVGERMREHCARALAHRSVS